MAYNDLILAISIASFAVQQFNNLLPDFIVTWVLRDVLATKDPSGNPPAPRIGFFTEVEAKRYVLGLLSWIWGIGISWALQDYILILHRFYPDWKQPFLDIMFTGLVIGAGTDGVNSLLKFAQYAKQVKGSQAVSAVAREAGLLPLGGADAAPALPVCPPNPDTDYGAFMFNRDPRSLNPLLLQHAVVQPIFWGDYWQSGAAPSKDQIVNALRSIASPPFISGLQQYCIENVRVLEEQVIPFPFADTGSFQAEEVPKAIVGWLLNSFIALPSTDQMLFMVFMPPGLQAEDGSFGSHFFLSKEDLTSLSEEQLQYTSDALLHYAWITAFNSAPERNGTLGAYTIACSHELVEACTNPEGTGWTGVQEVSCPGLDGWCEIADSCSGKDYIGLSNGVLVQSYWSNHDKTCILPT